MATISQRETALNIPHLPPPTDLSKTHPTQKNEHSQYLSARRDLMAKYNAALFAKDGKDEAVKLRAQITELDRGMTYQKIVLPEVKITPMNIGRPGEAFQQCKKAADTRKNVGTDRQGFGNCNLEAWRSLVNGERAKKGLPAVTEEEFLKTAQDLGVAGKNPAEPWAIGATDGTNMVKVLDHYGVKAETMPAKLPNIDKAILEKKHMSVTVDPSYIWPDSAGAKKGWVHAIAVTGVERDENGKITGYVVTDSGLGSCSRTIPKAKFEQALYDQPVTVTSQPVSP